MRTLLVKLASITTLVAVLSQTTAPPAAAQRCFKADFAEAVDQAGAALRRFNAESAPKLQARLRQLKDQRGWAEADYEVKAFELLSDSRSEALDRRANDLLARLDRLGADVPDGNPDCAALADLQATGIELLATMKAKSSHMQTRLDGLLGAARGAPAAAASSPSPAPAPLRVAPAPPAAATTSPKPRPDEPPAWSTSMRIEPDAPSPTPAPPPAAVVAVEGFTMDEIRAASQGFFGQLSTGLASVIEHAFAKSGRPTAYVLGTEGGGAFLAGLRYGTGTLYLRSGGASQIHWHGPSIGYDFGAAGSKTMFLIYGAGDAASLYSAFTGIDGSAYLVGGVGITLLSNGRITMAPIRTGIGLRLGASIGYIRFTPRPTWNPF